MQSLHNTILGIWKETISLCNCSI